MSIRVQWASTLKTLQSVQYSLLAAAFRVICHPSCQRLLLVQKSDPVQCSGCLGKRIRHAIYFDSALHQRLSYIENTNSNLQSQRSKQVLSIHQ